MPDPDMKVVCNTTPIITLTRIGHLRLLKDIYGKIYIPAAVYDEITAKQDVVSENLAENGEWIEVQIIKNTKMKRLFSSSLHEGEVETIMLADEMNAGLLILDDLLARKYAIQAGFRITGTLGILIKAKQSGLVNEVKPLLDGMVQKGIYVNKQVYNDVLAIVKE